MATVITIPVVTLTNLRFCWMVHLKSDGDVEFESEVDALVWDPTAVRALLDERIYRNPIVVLVAPGTRGFEA